MNSTRPFAYTLFAALLVALLVGCSDEPAQDAQAPAATSQGLPSFTALVREAAPSVVEITVSPAGHREPGSDQPNSWEFGDQSQPLRKWLEHFLDPRDGHHRRQPPQHQQQAPARLSTGSGFIISEDGYILTARHVVQGADEVLVRLSNRRQLTAKVVGSDEYSGIALLKVDASDLNPVDIGSVKSIQPGAWVIAIGAPFGFQNSVSAGIVSGKHRHLSGAQYVPFIQTDVAINPGSSGGPLFNLSGEVVGVNARIFSRSGGYQGLSFAIPINIAMDVARQLMEGEAIAHGWLGVQIQEVTQPLADSFGMQWPHGALIAHIVPGTPAAASALQAGDVIVKYNGEAVPTVAALPPLVGMTEPGETVNIVVFRDGEKQSIAVEIGMLNKTQWHGNRNGGTHSSEPPQSPLGLRMRPLEDQERKTLGIPTGGVRIIEVAPGPARRAGFKAGDVIASVSAKPVVGPDALRQRLIEADEPIALRVLRDGGVLYIAFEPDF